MNKTEMVAKPDDSIEVEKITVCVPVGGARQKRFYPWYFQPFLILALSAILIWSTTQICQRRCVYVNSKHVLIAEYTGVGYMGY